MKSKEESDDFANTPLYLDWVSRSGMYCISDGIAATMNRGNAIIPWFCTLCRRS
jgi:hypothetical protein